MIRDCVSLLCALTLIAMTFGVLRFWQKRRSSPSAEVVRKAAHISSGVIAAAFPWLFHSVWPGLALCAIALFAMIAMRLIPTLRGSLGRVTGSVERQTWGELYFPIAVACVWVLSEQDPLLFVVPVLLLTFADAAAAIVGVAFGQHRFRTSEGHKSVEGSLAFVAVSTACTIVALSALQPGMDIVKSTLVALLLSCVLMIFEAIAWRGLDNLLLPVMAFVLLRLYLTLDVSHLAVRLAVLALIVTLMIVIRKRRTLTGEGVLAAALFLYFAWAIGEWPWLVPPAMVVVLAPWMPRHPDVPSVSIHGVFPVVALSAAGMIVLVSHVQMGVDLWSAYVATFAASLSVVACIQLHARLDRALTVKVLMLSLVVGVVPMVVLGAVLAGMSLTSALHLLVLALSSAAMACGVAFIPVLTRAASDGRLWLLRGTAVSLGAACAAGLDIIMTTLR